jgi:hypothetical protein
VASIRAVSAGKIANVTAGAAARARLSGGALLLTVFAYSPLARAEPPAPDLRNARESAAAAYDRGVAAYDHGEYAAATDAFLAADALVPNDDALANALAAARHTHDRRLLEAAGRRGLEREREAPALGDAARAALAEAATLPETTPEVSQVAAAPVPVATAAPAAAAPEVTADKSSRPWPPAVFYAGAGATLVLTGLTVWSGVDTIQRFNRLPGTPEQTHAVKVRENRSDVLLAATLVTAGATAFIGLRLVDWSPRTELTGSLSRDAATLTLRGVW